MHKSRALLPLFFVVGGSAGFGAVPIARVISTEPVAVDWIASPARNFMPVGLGGDVSSGSASALLQFSDGSSVVLQPNSELKIEGSAGKPVIRVIRGSAEYKLSTKSRIRITNGGQSETVDPVKTVSIRSINKDTQNAKAQAGLTGQTDSSLAGAAAMYRATAGRTTGVILPSSPISTGSFPSGSPSIGKGAPGFFNGASLDVSGTTAEIILPNQAVVINLTATVNPVTNLVTYTVASITQTVQLPNGGGTATITINGNTQTTTLPNGTTTTVPVDRTSSGLSLLIGSTAGVAPPQTATDQVKVSFTPPNAIAPLTDAQAAAAVTDVGTTAVQTAINTNTIPGDTKPPVVTQILQGGSFSSSAP